LFSSLAHADFKWGERFVHQFHAAQMQAKGQQSPRCNVCHLLDARDFSPIAPGRFNHKPCIDCHSGAAFQRGPRCLTCHSNIKAFKPGRPYFPPYRSPGEFHTTFSHAKHVSMIARSPQADTCGGCHAKQEGRAPGKLNKGHSACASCHAGQASPDMNACESCHFSGPAPPKPPTMAAANSPFRVTAHFEHASHASHAAKRGVRAACTSCHAGLGNQEPPGRPTMQACEGCHDGTHAFDARGTQCSKCHAQSGAGLPVMAIPPGVFTHTGHRGTLDVNQCGTCHSSGLTWQQVHAGRNQHQPCQNCHAAEFRFQNQKICLGCHERNDPFAPNPLRPPQHRQGRISEWRMGEVPHPPHIAAGVSCGACHAEQTAAILGTHAPVKVDTGHALCGKCHTEGQKLAMSRCNGCHVWAGQPPPQHAIRPWSTKERFKHDANHKAASCDPCHRAGGAQDLVPPKMQYCGDTCHDGTKAFKVTGFGCAKCHGRTQ
jgi:hypothetical protein